MQWVKASERLPEGKIGMDIFGKNKQGHFDVFGWDNQIQFWRPSIYDYGELVEWLDESPSPQSEQQIKEWIEYGLNKKILRKIELTLSQGEWINFYECINAVLPEIQKRDEEIKKLQFDLVFSEGETQKRDEEIERIQNNRNENDKFWADILEKRNQTIEEQKAKIDELMKEGDQYSFNLKDQLEKHNYWKQRCELAEHFADPDPLYMRKESKILLERWQQLKSTNQK